MSTDTLADTWLLESLLNAEPPKCESKHSDPDNLVCTGSVVARASCCERRTMNVCYAYVRCIQKDLAMPFAVCAGCGRAIGDCWQVIPI